MSGTTSCFQRFHGRTSRAVSHHLALVLLGLIIVLTSGCGRGASRDSISAALAAVRSGEGRLVGAPRLQPAPPGLDPSSNAEVRRAVRDSSRALEEKLTAETLRNDAVAKLLAGEGDTAIVGLSKAVELAPKDSRPWSDLSAAHLQRGAAARDPYEFVLALSAANRAINRDPRLLAAYFNRALALQRLSLWDRAGEDWRLVARMEPDRLWAREAREHAKVLERPASTPDWERQLAAVEEAVAQGKPGQVQAIVSGSRQSFREYLEEKLLTGWAIAEDEHRELEAARKLAVAKSIAEALVAAGGDRMAADTISRIGRLSPLDPTKRRLVSGFVAYSKGLNFVGKNLCPQALAHFETARELLAGQESPFAYWATYRIAFCHYQVFDYCQARAQLAALARDPGSAPYKALRGRSLLLIGLIDGIEGRHTAAVTSLEAGEAAFRAVGEIPLAAKLGATLATEFDVLGQHREAWRRLYPSLVEPAAFGSPESRLSVCLSASELARQGGEIEIALWFEDEVLKHFQLTGQHAGIVGELCKHAFLLAALGKKTEASADLARARSSLQQITGPLLRRSIEGDLLLAEGELAAAGSPREAIAKLNEAIPIFRTTSYHYRIGHALYLRALAEKTLGQNNAAERDLAAAIAESEQQRETIAAAGDRISYLDRQKEIFDTMIAFQLERRQRADTALQFSEQAKARVLWDWMLTRSISEPVPPVPPPAATPLDLPSLQRELPAGTAVIEYAVLPDKLIIWVLHRQGELRWQTVQIGEGAFGDLIQQFRRALIEKRSADLESISKRLHDALIRPVASYIVPGERLVLIPDGALHTLPFSLLRDRQTGRYLIQDHIYAVAPSARVFAASRRRDMDLARRPERRALVIAAPDFDLELEPTLTVLKAGETESAIARIFPGSRVLREGAATRGAFLQAAADFEILHFGGHSVINADLPLLSKMLFAKDPADPARGALYSGDVLRQRFPRTRLVVLASCGTAFGKVSRTEGVESLARPFLATGVPAVVASLWTVDDAPTAEFFALFYRHLKQRFDAAGALQAAQVELIEHGAGPAARPLTWGAFEVIGDTATDAFSSSPR
jgi:CHAT domain-containing protein